MMQVFKERILQYKLTSLFALSLEDISFYIDTFISLVLAVSVILSQLNPDFSLLCLKVIIFTGILRLSVKRDVQMVDKNIFFLIGFFIIIQIISSLNSEYPKESLFYVRIRSIYYMTFFASIMFIKNQNQVKTILGTLVIFVSVISIIELSFYSFDLFVSGSSPVFNRLHLFGHPTTTSEIKMMVLLIIIPLLFEKENFFFPRIWLCLMSIPIFLSLYFTYTRSAYFGLLAGCLIITFVKNKKIFFLIIILNACFILFAPDSLKGRILSSADSSFPSNKARLYMIETGVRIAMDHPFFGVGNAKFKEIYEKYKRPSIIGEGVHLHSNVLQILATMGMFGLLSWLGLMFYIFKKQISAYKLTKKHDFLNCIVLSSFVSMIAFQICGMTDWNFADYPVVTLLWFSVSLSFLAEKFLNGSADYIPE